MWYCSECGQKNEGRFCVKCGAEYIDAEPPEYPEPPQKKGNKGLIIAIIAAAAVLIIGAIVGIVAFAGGGEDEEAEGTGIYYYVSNEDGSAPMYEDHNIQSTVLLHLSNGSPVELLKTENDVFLYVIDRGSGLSGYMRSDDLVESAEDVISEEKTEETIEEISLGEYYVTNTTDYLALRDAPGSDGNIVSKLYNGYCVSLLEQTSSKYWYVFDYNSGEYGYVLKGYLTDDESKVKSGVETVKQPTSTTIIADYYVTGTKNYLAIRSAPSSSSTVEIGKSYNGNVVGVIEKTNSTFWYVYDYSSGLYGYVKCAYLSASYSEPKATEPSLGSDEYVVTGTKNYLAIRSEPSSSETVEIGKSYNGNVVQVIEKTNSTFWYVYDYSSGLYGYVKCAYLSK